jgi:hypothetical protein
LSGCVGENHIGRDGFDSVARRRKVLREIKQMKSSYQNPTPTPEAITGCGKTQCNKDRKRRFIKPDLGHQHLISTCYSEVVCPWDKISEIT